MQKKSSSISKFIIYKGTSQKKKKQYRIQKLKKPIIPTIKKCEEVNLADRFTNIRGFGYIYKNDFYIWSIIAKEKGRGYFREMVNKLLAEGYTIKVVVPIYEMPIILEKMGFERTIEYLKGIEPTDVWVLKKKP